MCGGEGVRVRTSITSKAGARSARLAVVGAIVAASALIGGGTALAGLDAGTVPSAKSAAEDQYEPDTIVPEPEPTAPVPEPEPTVPEPEPTVVPTPEPEPTTQVAGASETNPVAATPQPVATNDTLPFTGVGLASTAVIGASLLAIGVYLRRRSSGHRS
jgi:DNA polymerase-3 subunit gamma/tau